MRCDLAAMQDSFVNPTSWACVHLSGASTRCMSASHQCLTTPAACLLTAAMAALLLTLDWTCVQWENVSIDAGRHSTTP